MQFNTLVLEDLIIHKVPGRGDENAVGPLLSDGVSEKDPNVFAFFRRRLSGVMGSRGLEIEIDTLRETDAAAMVVLKSTKNILNDPTSFVLNSQRIAQRLWDTQDRRNSAGLLVVLRGRVDGLACLGLLKLENERGVQAKESRDAQGKITYNVVLHDDLLLTDHTAVFKCAVLRTTSDTDDSLVAEASDLQNQREVAGFFLTEFLACKFVQDPAELTLRYFESTEQFVLEKVDDPEKIARYEGALLSQMNSSQSTVDPLRFANENLEVGDHQPFLNFLADRGVASAPFIKDVTRIKPKIKRVGIVFASGLKVIGTPDSMQEHVTSPSGDKSQVSEVVIKDKITRISGRG